MRLYLPKREELLFLRISHAFPLNRGREREKKWLLKSRLLIVTAFPKDSKMGCACRILCWIFWVNWLLEPETKPRYCMTLSPRAF